MSVPLDVVIVYFSTFIVYIYFKVFSSANLRKNFLSLLSGLTTALLNASTSYQTSLYFNKYSFLLEQKCYILKSLKVLQTEIQINCLKWAELSSEIAGLSDALLKFNDTFEYLKMTIEDSGLLAISFTFFLNLKDISGLRFELLFIPIASFCFLNVFKNACLVSYILCNISFQRNAVWLLKFNENQKFDLFFAIKKLKEEEKALILMKNLNEIELQSTFECISEYIIYLGPESGLSMWI